MFFLLKGDNGRFPPDTRKSSTPFLSGKPQADCSPWVSIFLKVVPIHPVTLLRLFISTVRKTGTGGLPAAFRKRLLCTPNSFTEKLLNPIFFAGEPWFTLKLPAPAFTNPGSPDRLWASDPFMCGFQRSGLRKKIAVHFLSEVV